MMMMIMMMMMMMMMMTVQYLGFGIKTQQIKWEKKDWFKGCGGKRDPLKKRERESCMKKDDGIKVT